MVYTTGRGVYIYSSMSGRSNGNCHEVEGNEITRLYGCVLVVVIKKLHTIRMVRCKLSIHLYTTFNEL